MSAMDDERDQEKRYIYQVRNEVVRVLGYRDYKAYLRSDEWRELRAAILQQYPSCICCDQFSQVVHHVRYISQTMAGMDGFRHYLAPLCHACHEKIEITEDGEKGSMPRANTMMFDLARKKDPKQPWLKAYYDGCAARKRMGGMGAFRDHAQRREAHDKAAADRRPVQPFDGEGVFWFRAGKRRRGRRP